MKRLFFALWPDQITRQQCHQLTHGINSFGKPVTANNLHVTLVFLGTVDEVQQRAMKNAAKHIEIAPLCLTFNRISFWKKPAIVCLRAERTDTALLNLVDKLTSAAIQAGIQVDERPYIPHVTLLRKAKVLPQIEFKSIIWQADGFCLVESCSTPFGVEYRVMERWDMAD